MTTPLEALTRVWTPGKHSLVAEGSGPFRTIGRFDNPADLLERAKHLVDTDDLWWGVHPVRDGVTGRGKRSDVTGVGVLCADYDWYDPAAHIGNGSNDLPTRDEVIRLVENIDPAPTLIIDSGHGLQPYWVLDRVLTPAEGTELIRGFFARIERETGLSNERFDLASVLRVPGTKHIKKASPGTARVHYMEPA